MTVAILDDREVPLRWALDELAANNIETIEQSCTTEDEVIETACDADAVVMVIAPMTARVLAELPRCQAIVKSGVGVDTIDLTAATELGIAVANVGNYCATDVAEHALSLAFALVRKHVAADRQVRDGGWDRTAMAPVHRVSATTLGVVGLGAIGRSLADRWRALGGRVIAYDPYGPTGDGPVEQVRTLEELLPRAQVLSMHVPLTPETRGLIGERELALLPERAFVVNTSRGEVVDSSALCDALRSGHVGGAGLDVWDPEPIEPGDPIRELPNVILTAHYAGYSEESFDDLRQRVLDQLFAVRDGRIPEWTLNGVADLRRPAESD
jgi:D-3-phosphoglycerate dehydrogenase